MNLVQIYGIKVQFIALTMSVFVSLPEVFC